jgi:hypothetical protein
MRLVGLEAPPLGGGRFATLALSMVAMIAAYEDVLAVFIQLSARRGDVCQDSGRQGIG